MEDWEYISVSDYARQIGKSSQHVYNLIRSGELETIKFKRGEYNGVLIKRQLHG